MKAIVNVNKGSAYAHLNGLTFPVIELLRTMAILDVGGITTDFYNNEFFIENIQEEFKKAFDNKENSPGAMTIYNNLNCYIRIKKIKW